jgi:hypothetical protein
VPGSFTGAEPVVGKATMQAILKSKLWNLAIEIKN